MDKTEGATGRRHDTPPVPTHQALLEGDSRPFVARAPGEEKTRALPCDAQGNPLVLAHLLYDSRPTPVVVPVLGRAATVEVPEAEPVDRDQELPAPTGQRTRGGIVQEFVADEPSAAEQLAPPTEGAPTAEIPPLTSAELSSVFPPEMREPAADAAVRALDQAQAGAPSRMTCESTAFADFSTEIDTTRGPKHLGAALERDLDDVENAGPVPPRPAARATGRGAIALGALAAAAAGAVSLAYYAGLLS